MPHLNKQEEEIQKQIDRQFNQIEHCDEPDCPECNKKAYLRGKKDVLKSLREKLEKGYELQTVVESLEVELEVEILLSKS